jgi:hypothetical protein
MIFVEFLGLYLGSPGPISYPSPPLPMCTELGGGDARGACALGVVTTGEPKAFS